MWRCKNLRSLEFFWAIPLNPVGGPLLLRLNWEGILDSATLWTVVCQAPLSSSISQSLLWFTLHGITTAEHGWATNTSLHVHRVADSMIILSFDASFSFWLQSFPSSHQSLARRMSHLFFLVLNSCQITLPLGKVGFNLTLCVTTTLFL